MRGRCEKAEEKGATGRSWWWCPVRGIEISPIADCGSQCEFYKPEEQGSPGAVSGELRETARSSELGASDLAASDSTGGAPMPERRGIDWEGTAGEIVDGWPTDRKLWEACYEKRMSGQGWTELGKILGCVGDSVRSAVERRAKREGLALPERRRRRPAAAGEGEGEGEGETQRTQREGRGERGERGEGESKGQHAVEPAAPAPSLAERDDPAPLQGAGGNGLSDAPREALVAFIKSEGSVAVATAEIWVGGWLGHAAHVQNTA